MKQIANSVFFEGKMLFIPDRGKIFCGSINGNAYKKFEELFVGDFKKFKTKNFCSGHLIDRPYRSSLHGGVNPKTGEFTYITKVWFGEYISRSTMQNVRCFHFNQGIDAEKIAQVFSEALNEGCLYYDLKCWNQYEDYRNQVREFVANNKTKVRLKGDLSYCNEYFEVGNY